MLTFILFACDSTNTTYPINNNTSSDGQTATECGPEGILAMSAAPVVIEAIVASDCGETSFQVRTVIVKNDQAHGIASVCDDNLKMELYYSTDRQAIANLSGEDLLRTLPSNVGRLVHKFKNNALTNMLNEFYVGNATNYSANRLSFGVKLPSFVIDLYAFQQEFGNDISTILNPVAINKITNAPKLRNGQTVYYRWAKYIEIEGDEDLLLFDQTTRNVIIELPLEIELNSPFSTIDLAQENSTLLNARIIGDSTNVISLRWRYVPINFGPEIDPVIRTPFQKTTEVEFKDFGKHAFEFEVTDDCGNILSDTINILVKGQL